MNDKPPTLRFRYFRFGLRTMFVVLTAFSLWLGWQTKIVRDRREAMRELVDSGRGSVTTSNTALSQGATRPPRIPSWRGWLGDEAIASIVVYGSDDYSARRQDLAALFPETSVFADKPIRCP